MSEIILTLEEFTKIITFIFEDTNLCATLYEFLPYRDVYHFLSICKPDNNYFFLIGEKDVLLDIAQTITVMPAREDFENNLQTF